MWQYLWRTSKVSGKSSADPKPFNRLSPSLTCMINLQKFVPNPLRCFSPRMCKKMYTSMFKCLLWNTFLCSFVVHDKKTWYGWCENFLCSIFWRLLWPVAHLCISYTSIDCLLPVLRLILLLFWPVVFLGENTNKLWQYSTCSIFMTHLLLLTLHRCIINWLSFSRMRLVPAKFVCFFFGEVASLVWSVVGFSNEKIL